MERPDVFFDLIGGGPQPEREAGRAPRYQRDGRPCGYRWRGARWAGS